MRHRLLSTFFICLLSTIFIFLLSTNAYALACVSTGTGGLWANSSTWTSCGGGVPGDGDTASIADGDIVTIASSTTVTVGADGAANAFAINLQSDDSDLIIQDNVTLNVKGSIDIDGGEFTVGAGVDIIFNATNNQRIYIGDNYDPSVAENMFDINGTAGNRSSIDNAGTGVVNIQCKNAEDSPCRIAMDYTDVTDLGSSSVDAIAATSRNLSNFGWLNLTNVTFDGCGMVNNINTLKNGFDYNLVNVTVRNTLDAAYGIRIFNSTTPTTGDRTISGSVFEDTIRFEEPMGFTISAFFLGGISSVTSSGVTYTLSDSIIYDDSQNELSLAYSTADGSLYIGNNPTATNPHLLTGLVGDYDQSWTNSVITCDWSDDTGDIFLLGIQPTQARTLTLTGNIIPPGPSGNGCGTLISQLGNQFSRWIVEHNTIAVDSQPAIAVGETYSGTPGMSSNVTNNLIVNLSGGAADGYIVADSGADDNVEDLIASSAIDYNGIFNLAGVENNLEFSSGTPNTNGVVGDPEFVDTGCRTVADYRDDTKSTTGSTIAQVIAELAKKNDADWDSDYALTSILAYFRGCWAPANASFEAANDADFGGWMGAVEGSVPAATGNPNARMLMGIG